MELLTIPFSQRAASDPVTRRKARAVIGEYPAASRRTVRSFVSGFGIDCLSGLLIHSPSKHIPGDLRSPILLGCSGSSQDAPRQSGFRRLTSPAYTKSYSDCVSGGSLTWQRVLAVWLVVGLSAGIAEAQANTGDGKA